MPTDPPDALPTFLAAWATVAAVALPLLVGGRLLARREAFWPRWRVVPFRGTLLDWLLLYVAYLVALGLAMSALESAGGARFAGPDAGQRRLMAAGFFALPAVLAAAAVLRHVVHELRPAFDVRTLPGDVARGAVVGVVLTPAVHAVFWVTKTLNAAAGGAERDHPLAVLGAGTSPSEVAFFLLAVCVVVPWTEELLFRGVMLRWLGRRAANAVPVFAVALLFAGTEGAALNPRLAPTLFVVALAALTLATSRLRAARTVRIVLASSALFAAAHSSVWPSPVPLFVLACGLGYLTVRTGRITAAVVAHGLFNAVSTVILLRQPAG